MLCAGDQVRFLVAGYWFSSTVTFTLLRNGEVFIYGSGHGAIDIEETPLAVSRNPIPAEAIASAQRGVQRGVTSSINFVPLSGIDYSVVQNSNLHLPPFVVDPNNRIRNGPRIVAAGLERKINPLSFVGKTVRMYGPNGFKEGTIRRYCDRMKDDWHLVKLYHADKKRFQEHKLSNVFLVASSNGSRFSSEGESGSPVVIITEVDECYLIGSMVGCVGPFGCVSLDRGHRYW